MTPISKAELLNLLQEINPYDKKKYELLYVSIHYLPFAIQDSEGLWHAFVYRTSFQTMKKEKKNFFVHFGRFKDERAAEDFAIDRFLQSLTETKLNKATTFKHKQIGDVAFYFSRISFANNCKEKEEKKAQEEPKEDTKELTGKEKVQAILRKWGIPLDEPKKKSLYVNKEYYKAPKKQLPEISRARYTEKIAAFYWQDELTKKDFILHAKEMFKLCNLEIINDNKTRVRQGLKAHMRKKGNSWFFYLAKLDGVEGLDDIDKLNKVAWLGISYFKRLCAWRDKKNISSAEMKNFWESLYALKYQYLEDPK